MNGDVTVFAETNFRNQRRKFGIKRDDRRRHMYVVGKTGMGKSTLLENMIIADIRAGNGLAVVDPHGDLAEKILEYIPNNRVNDVIYFNPSDTKYPIAFNILESIGEDYKHLVAYGLVGVFKKIWADSWGPRMEYIMTNTILALLEYPGSTLLGLMRMLVDKAYRKKVVSKITDPVVKTFWADEYANYSEKFRTEAIAPIQNKVGQFLASAIIRNIVGQSKSTIEMRDIMDKQKILIMNLAKGRIGEENSALLGAMMITKLQIAAMSRVDIKEADRKDFYLYVDEFQNFATDSFAGILSEARKYRLCLIMAHQYFEQLGDVVKAAVFGNVGTMIVFRVGAADAAELELEFAPQFLPADIVNLKKYTFCLRLMVDGVATEPFSGVGLAPAAGATSNKDKIIKVSRERYARPQEMVEDRIIRWSGVEINRPSATSADGKPLVADADGDEGDDMNWPEPTWKADLATDEEVDTAPEIAADGIQLEAQPQANVKVGSAAYVDSSGFIPGDPGRSAEPAVPAVQFAQPAVQLEPDQPQLVKPTVRLAPEQPVEPMGPRPRISFINHQSAESLSTLNKSEDAESVETDPTEAKPEPEVKPTQKLTPVAEDAEENDEDYEDDEPEVVPAVVLPKTVPATVVTTVTTVATQPVPANTPSPVTTVSLQALKQGTAQSVKFSGSQSTPQGSSAPVQSAPANPSGNAAVTNLNNLVVGSDGQAKRKRKRKRKRGGSGEGGNPTANGSSNNGSSAGNMSNSFPSPVVSNPQPSVRAIQELPPQQSKPSTTPSPAQSPAPAQSPKPAAPTQPSSNASFPSPVVSTPKPGYTPMPQTPPVPKPQPAPTPQSTVRAIQELPQQAKQSTTPPPAKSTTPTQNLKPNTPKPQSNGKQDPNKVAWGDLLQ